MAAKAAVLVPSSTAPRMVTTWFTDDNDGFEQLLAKLASEVDGGDTPNPICPTLPALKTMPSQHDLSQRLYTRRNRTLLSDRRLSREDRAFFLSGSQEGAGVWLNAVPSIYKFRCASAVFKIMLQIRLGLHIGHTDTITRCKCGMMADTSFRNGRHWMTKCPKGHRIIIHNLHDHIV